VLRALLLATLVFVSSGAASGQALSVLHITVVLVDAEGKATPVPRYVLLVSDNPSTAPPRRIFTKLDGTADVRMRPGNYTVESDLPVAFEGQAYRWTQIVDIAANRDSVLELRTDNAKIESVASATTTSARPLETDPSFLMPQWQDSVVALWTPKTHASGFLVDERGLIVTNQRVIDTATSVEVQITPEIKVAASVLAADPVRDVAVLWVDANAVTALRPVPLGCAQAVTVPVADGQELFTIGAPLRGPKGMTSGIVSRVGPRAIVSDFRLPRGSAGGPVFTVGGDVLGITSVENGEDESLGGDSRVVRVHEACALVAAAEQTMKDAAPPNGAHLPVEPARTFPVSDVTDAEPRRAGSLSPYQMSSSDFDVVFITPLLTQGAPDQSETALQRRLLDFGNWADYVRDVPPVLLVRVTPKLVEGFWTRVARGAARTQGVSLPPFAHIKTGFARMRALCGDDEVTPIHRFTLEQRVSEGDPIDEGLYVFDPKALGPHCGTVTLVMYSEKEPNKGDTRVVAPKVLQQIWQDLAPYLGASQQ
jgi:S1-C subfamily serine protease